MTPQRTRSFVAVALVAVVVVVAAIWGAQPRRRMTPTAAPAACAADLSDLVPAPPASEDVTYAWHLGRRVGFPVVRGEIAGCAVRVLLDTGVSTPMLAPWFADRLALPRRRAGGRELDIGGFEAPLDATDPLVFDLPGIVTNGTLSTVLTRAAELEGYGIAAIVPPQFAVAPGRVYALDLAAGTYRRLASEADVDALALGAPTFTAESDCNGELLVPAVVEGRRATLLLDTGSVISTLYSESEAGGSIAARVTSWERRERTPFGGSEDESIVYGIGVRVGDLAGPLPMSVIRRRGLAPDGCAFDGALGMDFLVDRHCLLLFDLGAEVLDHPGQFYGRVRGYCRP